MIGIKKYQQSIWNEIVLMLLALVSVGLLVYEFSVELAPHETAWLYKLDIVIASVFLTDFLLGLMFSDNKARYWKENWYLLLASIPIPEGIFQSMRALRLLRLVRIIRLIARIKRVSTLASRISERGSGYIYAASIFTVVVMTGAVAIFTVEADANPNINNFFDAIWWACTTITTVGYGDVYPVTWEGRLVAIALMFFGIGLVGAVAGLVVGGIIRNDREENQ